MTAKEIGTHSSMHKTKVSRAVAELEARRWIKREENLNDRREDHLTLTALGLRVNEEIVPDMIAFQDRLKSKLGSSVASELLSVLDRLETLIEGDGP